MEEQSPMVREVPPPPEEEESCGWSEMTVPMCCGDGVSSERVIGGDLRTSISPVNILRASYGGFEVVVVVEQRGGRESSADEEIELDRVPRPSSATLTSTEPPHRPKPQRHWNASWCSSLGQQRGEQDLS